MNTTSNPRPNGRVNPTQDIAHQESNEKLKKLFYDYTNIPDKSNPGIVNMGYLLPIDHHKFVVHFMEKWVAYQDHILDQLREGTKAYADAFALRGFTFQEYKFVLSGRVKEDYFSHHRVFDYLYLTNQADRDYFTAIHLKEDSNDRIVAGYIEAISEAIKEEIPILKYFFFETQIPLYFRQDDLKKHAYFLAGSGSGKTEMLKLIFYDLQRRSQINRSNSLVLIEPHGDFSTEALQFSLNAGEYKNRVIYLDPFIRDTAIKLLGEDILGADYTFTLNPFDVEWKTEREISYLTQQLSNAFFEIIKSEETFQMKAVISACVETLLRMGGKSISDLKRFMDNNANDDLIEFGSTIPNEQRSTLIANLKGNKDFKLAPTKSGIFYRLLNLLGDKQFRLLLEGKSTIDLEKELNSGKVIICNIPTTLGEDSAPAFGKLLLALIKGFVMKRVNQPKKSRKSIYCFVDEFQNFTTPTIETIMAESRKYGLHMLLSHQQKGQEMDNKMKRIITGNTAIKVAGDNEPDSIDFMCQQMGKLTPKDFDELPKYSLFTYNNQNKKGGVSGVRIPDFLVEQKSPFYMSKSELKSLILYLVHESGYYKKVELKEENKDRKKESFPIREKESDVYEPKFED